MHMIRTGKFSDKKILLIDRQPKTANDRTWCFWQKEGGLFEDIVYRRWQHMWFHGGSFSSRLDIAPYQYKMIRGIDFYNHCMDLIARQANFTVLFRDVDHVFSTEATTGIITQGQTIHADY